MLYGVTVDRLSARKFLPGNFHPSLDTRQLRFPLIYFQDYRIQIYLTVAFTELVIHYSLCAGQIMLCVRGLFSKMFHCCSCFFFFF